MPSVTGTPSSAHSTGTTPSLSFPHTSNGDPLYVSVLVWSTTITTNVTYGGVQLTFIGRVVIGSVVTHEWWFLPAPAAGTANVVVTPTANIWLGAGARNVLGGGFGAHNLISATGTSTAPSVNVSSAAGELVLDLLGNNTTNQVFTPGTGQTADFAQSSQANTDAKVAGSWEAGAASVTMSWTLSISAAWYLSAISIPGSVPSLSAQVSQVALEVLTAPTAPATAQVSQVALEVATVADSSTIQAQVSQVAIEVLYIPGPPRITQSVVEAIFSPIPATRVTQSTVELLSQSLSPIRTTQMVVELLKDAGAAKSWLSQFVVETISFPTPAGRLSQVAVETLSLPQPRGRLSQVVVETISLPTPVGRLSQLVVETLQHYDPPGTVSGLLNTVWMGEIAGRIWIE